MDILLGISTHDLELDSSGNIQLTQTAAQSLGQRIKIKLLFFKNTYFLDLDFGIPYYEQVFIKGTSKKLLDALFKQAIFRTPEVGSILTYKSEFDRVNRKYSPTFTVISKDGQQTTVKV
jgi:hypothetical protein